MPNFHFFGGAEFAGKVADLAWKITKITIRFSPENKWRSYLHSWFVLWPHWLLGWYFGPTGLRLKVSFWGAIITPWVKLRKEGVRIIGLLSTPVKWKSSYLPGGLVSWLLYFLKQPCNPELLLLHTGSHQQHLLGRRRVVWHLKCWCVKSRRLDWSIPCMVWRSPLLQQCDLCEVWCGILKKGDFKVTSQNYDPSKSFCWHAYFCTRQQAGVWKAPIVVLCTLRKTPACGNWSPQTRAPWNGKHVLNLLNFCYPGQYLHYNGCHFILLGLLWKCWMGRILVWFSWFSLPGIEHL